MIGDIAVGVATAVFAVDVSRLARQVRDFATLLILCRSRGVVAVLDGRPINLNDPAEVAMAHVSAVFAEFNNAHRAATLRRARRAKAEMGHVVSQLPVGWIKRIDGSLDYDPEVAPAIRDVYAAFKETGSLRATAAALSGAGKALPARRYGRLKWVAPTADRVRSFLLNEAYGGDYIFGRTWSQPDPDNPGGRGIQVASPESEWIIKRGLLPRYVTPEEQRRFRERLQQNAFEKRHRPSGGRPLLHGLLECAICSGTLSVADPGERVGQHYYQCSRKR
jgi:DNA invertase Pin-like site-specific DNA recombinase